MDPAEHIEANERSVPLLLRGRFSNREALRDEVEKGAADVKVAETATLRAATMHMMVHNCVSTDLVIAFTGGEIFPHEVDVIQVSMVSVFAHVFDEDPDKVLAELIERVAQESALI